MPEPDRQQLKDDALLEYAHAAFLADPARLRGWEEQGLTLAQLRVLHLLHAEPQMTASELATRLGVRPSTVTGIVDRLVAQGLVERQADAEDRRVVRAALTEAGTATVSDFSRASRSYILSIFERLSDEHLHDVLRGVLHINRSASDLGLQVRAPGAATEGANS